MAATIHRSGRQAIGIRTRNRPHRCQRLWLAVLLWVPFTCVVGQGSRLAAPVLTDAAAQPFYFSLPAPRGQILDCEGNALARSAVVHRLTLRVPRLPRETADAFVAWVQEYWPEVTKEFPKAVLPDVPSLKQHFEHRRRIPVPISGVLRDSGGPETPALLEFIEMQSEYARDYPGGRLAAHVLGYVTAAGAPLRGPLLHGEPLWREIAGRLGLEASMNHVLTGEPGLLVVCYDKDGRALQRSVLKPPSPGRDVVTTIHREIQAAAEKVLAAAARPGAMVVMDAATGKLLAMASAPCFDPTPFAMGMDSKTFAGITGDADLPIFNRAIGAAYPPGSLFKIVVALAGLQSGQLHPGRTVPCGPEVTIDGRLFRNWSTTDRGWFDLNAALVRSCNTYFYQAALAIGDQPVLDAARQLGFGTPFKLPLPGGITGNLPESVPSEQGQANMAIGQSPVLCTPLEVALAMATLANGTRRPCPRLVAQVQDREGRALAATASDRETPLSFAPEHVSVIHQAMYSVVNHGKGTGEKARVTNLRVHGKTGTSQWSRDSEQVTAVWFAGFVKECDPPLAFAVVLEGSKWDRISGGNTAAPVAGQLLSQIGAAPEKYGVRARRVAAPYEQYSLGNIESTSLPGFASTPEIGKRGTNPLVPAPPALGAADLGEVRRAIPVAEPVGGSSLEPPPVPD